ncbi:MAG: hypothetical protein JWL59_3298 [Chthoniobacteraceae bacterium]|nr:hypothetical protein [Chthoniobacteraceae bacterium]
MKQTTVIFRLNAVMFILTVFCLTGCKPRSFHYSSSWSNNTSSSDSTTNGYRTSTRTQNGVTRKLETAAGIEIENGRVTKFPKAALAKLQESGGTQPRVAELRENADTIELWIQDNGTFRRGSAEDDSWLERFLAEFNSK